MLAPLSPGAVEPFLRFGVEIKSSQNWGGPVYGQ
jgi:hypothetical protein